jgi:hypothetical protein
MSRSTNASSGQPRRCIESVIIWSKPFMIVLAGTWWGVIRAAGGRDNCPGAAG